MVQIFQRGSKFFSKISSGGSLFIKKLVPGGNQFWGVHFYHDKHSKIPRGCKNGNVPLHSRGYANRDHVHILRAILAVVSCPAPPRTCEKGGSGVLNDFSCHSSPIRELESDCRTSSSMRSSIPAVRCTCTGNAIITFFTPFDPAPCDKKCRSEHQTLFPLFGGGVWGRDYSCGYYPESDWTTAEKCTN